ncbi:MAG: hypothetical protein ACOCV1_08145 [Bacillota bacterium]
MTDKEDSPYKCHFCGGQTERISFSEQVSVVTEMRENSNVDQIGNFDMVIMDALMAPLVAPHGMVKCKKCGKIQNITYDMIGKALLAIDSLPQGALPKYE